MEIWRMYDARGLPTLLHLGALESFIDDAVVVYISYSCLQ